MKISKTEATAAELIAYKMLCPGIAHTEFNMLITTLLLYATKNCITPREPHVWISLTSASTFNQVIFDSLLLLAVPERHVNLN